MTVGSTHTIHGRASSKARWEAEHGNDIVNLGLWGVKSGNGVIGTQRTLVFAAGAGVGDHAANIYEHGLIGLIVPNHQDDD
jgi:hypothetical protein